MSPVIIKYKKKEEKVPILSNILKIYRMKGGKDVFNTQSGRCYFLLSACQNRWTPKSERVRYLVCSKKKQFWV